MPIWWKVSVARNPATKPNASRVTDVETASDADRAMAFPPVMRGLGPRVLLQTITREKGKAYTTCASGEWIGFRDAAVGHRKAGASVGHTKRLVGRLMFDLPPKSGKAPQGVTMVRSLEQSTMRKVYMRILPFA